MTQQKESLITDEMRGVIGKESDSVTYEVDNTGCRQFARAVGYTDPIFFDEAAAKARGYRAIVAPPGFLGHPVMIPGKSAPRGPESLGFQTSLKRVLNGGTDYEYFADVMPNQTGPYADAINAIRKYVFSSTLESADWNNSTIIREDVVAAVTKLKQEDGGDLMMYGYGRLSRTLLEHQLVDEIRFSVHPVLLGGRAVGGGNGQTLPLKLLGATPSPSGVVALTYQPASS